MKIDIAQLDRHVKFLSEQATTLRRTQQGAAWAVNRAKQFDDVVTFLQEIRQDQQMTGMSGKRIE